MMPEQSADVFSHFMCIFVHVLCDSIGSLRELIVLYFEILNDFFVFFS